MFFSVSAVRSAARSTKGIVRLSSAQRSLITISDELRDILVGILLGDGLVCKVVKIIIFLASYYLLNINIDSTELALYPCSTLALIPILVYSNPKLDKVSILTENKGKSGIYM